MQARTRQILLQILRKNYPRAEKFLVHSNTWELLVATQLSAQCTDARVNQVTQKLFQKYPTLDDYVHASPREFEKDIFSTGFYRNKTRNILAAAKRIQHEFQGVVPNSMEKLLLLRGVARKTANVVLSQGFGVHEGIAVDTHVARVSKRLGLTHNHSPEKIERDLMKIVEPKDYPWISTALILHGRRVCFARKPACPRCVFVKICTSAVKT